MKLRAISLAILISFVLAGTVWGQSTTRGRGRAPATPTHTVRIQSNVPGAQLTIDGQGSQGALPQNLSLQQGNYTFRVTAPGYQEWSLSIDLDRDQNLVANLQAITHTLTVNSNVSGARVFINNQDRGTATFRDNLTPGSYNVTVSAPGYVDFSQSVNLNGNLTVNAQLRPATARVSFSIPTGILDQTVSNAASQIQIFVDGNRVSGTTFDVNVGQRTIRVRSGGLAAEITMDFSAGAQYTLTPFFSVSVE